MITEYTPLIPAAVAAGKFPKADEDKLTGLAAHWQTIGTEERHQRRPHPARQPHEGPDPHRPGGPTPDPYLPDPDHRAAEAG